MINLVPLSTKKEIAREETWRKIFLSLLFLLISLAVLILLTFLLKNELVSKIKDSEKTIQEEKKELESAQLKNLHELISSGNQTLVKIYNFRQEQISLLPLFEKLASKMPSSIYLTNFSLTKNKDKENEDLWFEVKLAGFAENRQALYSFKLALEEEKSFKEIYFLPYSWVKPTEVDFAFNFKYIPSK